MARQDASKKRFHQKLMDALKRLLRREPEAPEDPYAYATARRRPRPGGRSAAAVAEPPD